MRERRCTKCNEWFIEDNINFYFINKSFPEKGFTPECKKCLIKRATDIKKKNPERTREYCRKTNLRDKRKSDFRRWTKERRDNGKQYEYLKITGKGIIYGRKRQNKTHTITQKEWERCLEYFNCSCAYCGLSNEEHKKIFNQQLHKEHVEHNGSNDISNCVPSCKICNSHKWEYNIEDWYNVTNPNYTEERNNKIIDWIKKDYSLI